MCCLSQQSQGSSPREENEAIGFLQPVLIAYLCNGISPTFEQSKTQGHPDSRSEKIDPASCWESPDKSMHIPGYMEFVAGFFSLAQKTEDKCGLCPYQKGNKHVFARL